MGHAPYHTSYDGGLNNGQRGQSLHPSTRSRSMGHYGGYSDTEVMLHPAQTDPQRYYDSGGRYPGGGPMGVTDPYYENMRTQGPPGGPMGPMTSVQQGAMGGAMGGTMGGAYPTEDRRAQPPPPPPRK